MENKIDLSKCKRGDILISTHGTKLKYISPTPWEGHTYLDHVVQYLEDKDGNSFDRKNYGTRTNDGFVSKKNRKPEIDDDIKEIIHMSKPDEYFVMNVQLADWESVVIGNRVNKKVLCHFNTEIGYEKSLELANKIVDYLNR